MRNYDTTYCIVNLKFLAHSNLQSLLFNENKTSKTLINSIYLRNFKNEIKKNPFLKIIYIFAIIKNPTVVNNSDFL